MGTVVKKQFFLQNLTFFTNLDYKLYLGDKRSSILSVGSVKSESRTFHATLPEAPVLWADRVCVFNALLKAGLAGSPSNPFVSAPVLWAGSVSVFYALLEAGLAGSPSNPLVSEFCVFYALLKAGLAGSPLVSDLEAGNADLGFAKWFEELQSKPDRFFLSISSKFSHLANRTFNDVVVLTEKEATDRRKLVSKWHPTTKGTLRRNYRVPSKTEGRRLLRSIASLLSDDDHFRDATSHKGCQIRRESAHGESVCCNNVRALFDELPTPHLIVEITPFPAGPLTETDYAKAEKLERVLRSGPSV
ncbi:hypothetical protein CQW23_01332 [Capsicum baccatum]|uniref:Uncharacterized protein n=1 Tax=Capsicum baccatum TaxID=33114 RepID=A0A2G2XNE1_CAPBA|nr:hypothetical protein CQW23_01332 [Capsicum baccatum]